MAHQFAAEQRRRESYAPPGITQIYVDHPERKVVGYMCNECRRAFMNASYIGEQAAEGPANRCCWCEKHQTRKPQNRDGTTQACAGCKAEQEARNNEARWKREADLLARAIPATPDMEGFFDYECEHFYSDPDEYFDAHFNKAYPDSVDPLWIPIVYEAEPAGPDKFFDAERIIERANEQAEIDDEDSDCLLKPTPEAVAELQGVLDDWIEKHGPKNQWFKPGRPVRLDAELKHWLAENPDALGQISDPDEASTAINEADR